MRLVKACRAPQCAHVSTQQRANAQQAEHGSDATRCRCLHHVVSPAITLGSVAWVTNNAHAHCPHLRPPKSDRRSRVYRLKQASRSKVPKRPSAPCVLTDEDLSSELPAGGLTDGVEMVEPGETACLRVILATGKTKCVCRDRSA